MKPPSFSPVVAKMALFLVGAGYFAAFSELQLNPSLRNYLFLVPIQLGTLLYFFWWKPRQNKP